MRLIRDGEKGGGGVWWWGEKELIYLSLHCHHQNDSSIKMGSDESHFNVSVGSDGQRHKTCPQTTTFEEKGEPKRYRTEVLPLTNQPNALPLGQTGSLSGYGIVLVTKDIPRRGFGLIASVMPPPPPPPLPPTSLPPPGTPRFPPPLPIIPSLHCFSGTFVFPFGLIYFWIILCNF